MCWNCDWNIPDRNRARKDIASPALRPLVSLAARRQSQSAAVRRQSQAARQWSKAAMTAVNSPLAESPPSSFLCRYEAADQFHQGENGDSIAGVGGEHVVWCHTSGVIVRVTWERIRKAVLSVAPVAFIVKMLFR
jgi:hypothetical protein